MRAVGCRHPDWHVSLRCVQRRAPARRPRHRRLGGGASVRNTSRSVGGVPSPSLPFANCLAIEMDSSRQTGADSHSPLRRNGPNGRLPLSIGSRMLDDLDSFEADAVLCGLPLNGFLRVLGGPSETGSKRDPSRFRRRWRSGGSSRAPCSPVGCRANLIAGRVARTYLQPYGDLSQDGRL